MITGKLLEFL